MLSRIFSLAHSFKLMQICCIKLFPIRAVIKKKKHPKFSMCQSLVKVKIPTSSSRE